VDCPAPAVASSNIITMDVIDVPPIVEIYASTGSIVPPGTTVTFTSAVYEAGTSPIYQWMVNGKNITGANGPALIYTTTGKNDTISLMVTSTMNCAIPNYDISTLVMVPTTAVAIIPSPFDNVSLFPNPNKGSFNINGELNDITATTVSFEIINPLGQLLINGEAAVRNNKIDKSIDLGNVADGIYLMRIHTGQDSKVFRLAVQH
jgi:hypothetical protein